MLGPSSFKGKPDSGGIATFRVSAKEITIAVSSFTDYSEIDTLLKLAYNLGRQEQVINTSRAINRAIEAEAAACGVYLLT